MENTLTYTVIPSVNERSQVCNHNLHETSTEFMVTSTTVENVDHPAKDILNATEQEMVQQSSTIIHCTDHGDTSRGSQPIIAVIPPPENVPSVSCTPIAATFSKPNSGNSGMKPLIKAKQATHVAR